LTMITHIVPCKSDYCSDVVNTSYIIEAVLIRMKLQSYRQH